MVALKNLNLQYSWS